MDNLKIENQDLSHCLHCGTAVLSGAAIHDPGFCCHGCASVYKVLHELGLERYYALRVGDDKELGLPVEQRGSQQDYSYFDDPNFIAEHVRGESQHAQLILFLPAIHCSACVWLLEKLPSIERGIQSVEVDFPRSRAVIRFDRSLISPAKVAARLDSLGYPPTPLRYGADREMRQAASRAQLVRLGVAALSAGNVMMFSVSLYQGDWTGIEGEYRTLLSWACFVMALPAVFYAALPFYRSAISGLRVGLLHIDLPLSIGIIVGFVASTVNLILERPGIYYDSITVLIFLLLVGRRLQQRSVEKALDSADLLKSLVPLWARRVVGGKETPRRIEQVYVHSLKKGDQVEIRAGESFPADGTIISGESEINAAILSGESRPLSVSPGATIFAGTTNLNAAVVVEVSAVGALSRVGALMQLVSEASSRRAKVEYFVDQVSRRFVFAVLALAAITMIAWWPDVTTALDNVIALLVITCPCALGLATPVTFSSALGQAARRGIFIKGGEIIERLASIKRIYFDKTGTITSGELKLSAWIDSNGNKISAEQFGSQKEITRAICSLERNINHPTARALVSALSGAVVDHLEAVQRTFCEGLGVLGTISGVEWKIGNEKWFRKSGIELPANFLTALIAASRQGSSSVLVSKEGKLLGAVLLGDALRVEALQSLRAVSLRGITPYILTGDRLEVAEQVGQELGIPISILAERSPEEKCEIVAASVKELPTAMVGDGVNDAPALRAATVGIGVQGGAEVCLTVADVYISQNSLTELVRTLDGSHRTMLVLKRNLGISLLYNVIGASAAVLGYVSPVVAAAIMPLSSISVVLSASLARTFSYGDNLHSSSGINLSRSDRDSGVPLGGAKRAA